jgi:hypothetical protein
MFNVVFICKVVFHDAYGNIISVSPNALVKYIHPSAVQAQLNNPSQERTIKVESCLTTETIEGTSLALESVDYVEGGDSLALGVLSVGDSVADDTLEEGLENTTGLLVDH